MSGGEERSVDEDRLSGGEEGSVDEDRLSGGEEGSVDEDRDGTSTKTGSAAASLDPWLKKGTGRGPGWGA